MSTPAAPITATRQSRSSTLNHTVDDPITPGSNAVTAFIRRIGLLIIQVLQCQSTILANVMSGALFLALFEGSFKTLELASRVISFLFPGFSFGPRHEFNLSVYVLIVCECLLIYAISDWTRSDMVATVASATQDSGSTNVDSDNPLSHNLEIREMVTTAVDEALALWLAELACPRVDLHFHVARTNSLKISGSTTPLRARNDEAMPNTGEANADKSKEYRLARMSRKRAASGRDGCVTSGEESGNESEAGRGKPPWRHLGPMTGGEGK